MITVDNTITFHRIVSTKINEMAKLKKNKKTRKMFY